MLLKAGRFEESASWFERAAAGGTTAMRRAVAELIARAGAPRALQNLAERLKAERLKAGRSSRADAASAAGPAGP